MKTYAQFYRHSVTTNEPTVACDDRSMVRLDGRQSQLTHEHIAEQECSKRGYIAWALFRGESPLRAIRITKIVPLSY